MILPSKGFQSIDTINRNPKKKRPHIFLVQASQRQETGHGESMGHWNDWRVINGYYLNAENKYNDSYLVYTCV